MAISRLTKSSIGTFDRFQKTGGGLVSASYVFAFADGTSTYRTSPDGLTWTSYTTPGSVTSQYLTYHSDSRGWLWWGGSANYVPVFNKNLLTPKLGQQLFNNSNWVDTPTLSGWGQLYAGSTLYFGTTTKSKIMDETCANRHIYSSAPYNLPILRPAWDGGTTWAVLSFQQASTQWARYTTQGTTDGIMPNESEAVGIQGFSAWNTFAGPSGGNYLDFFYWSGYWFVINTSGTVYRTQTIATASPTWTNMGTLTNAYSVFFVANNELWILSGGSTATTAQKLSSPTGSWSSITLPASKASVNIVYGNGVYVIFNTDGTVYRSTTGASGSFASVSTGSTATYYYKLTGGFGPTNG